MSRETDALMSSMFTSCVAFCLGLLSAKQYVQKLFEEKNRSLPEPLSEAILLTPLLLLSPTTKRGQSQKTLSSENQTLCTTISYSSSLSLSEKDTGRELN